MLNRRLPSELLPDNTTSARVWTKVRQYAVTLNEKNRVLILKYRMDPNGLAGKWTLPGGRIGHFEQAHEAIGRVMETFLGSSARVTKRAVAHMHAYRLGLYYRADVDGEPLPRLTDLHEASAWVLPEELADYDFGKKPFAKIIADVRTTRWMDEPAESENR